VDNLASASKAVAVSPDTNTITTTPGGCKVATFTVSGSLFVG